VIKVYPEVIFTAIRHNRPAGAFRLWFIAKHYDRGNGFIPAKDFRRYVSAQGVNEKTFYRWLDQAIDLGLINRVSGAKPVYQLAAWEVGAAAAGINNDLLRAVTVPLNKFVAKGWLSVIWAGYLKHFEGKPISRAALESLTGVPARTQLEYETKAHVRSRANYASYGLAPDSIDQALEFIMPIVYRPGHYVTQEGEVRRRLPDTRTAPNEVDLANAGRLKRINQALYKEGSSQTIYKLYTENAKQSKRAQRRIRKTDELDRPDYIYERMGKLKGMGLYVALAA
jgi:hypothetical protein